MSSDTGQDELRQKLAAIEHKRWADWQQWMHAVLRKSGELTEGADEILQRWDKQIATPYDKLSDSEKASDMEQVDRYWPLIKKFVSAEVASELEKWAGCCDSCVRDRIKELQSLAGQDEEAST